MSGGSTLRRLVLAWVSIPMGILWMISAYIDYDIAKRYVNVAYDRALLESALDIGRQVRVLRGRIYVDLPEVAIQMLRTRETGQLFYMVTGPDREYITGEPDIKPAVPSASGQAIYYDDVYRNQPCVSPPSSCRSKPMIFAGRSRFTPSKPNAHAPT